MCDPLPSGSGLPKTIDLKINAGKVYNPAKHCVFCLDGGRPFNKLSSSENGRAKVKQVNEGVAHKYSNIVTNYDATDPSML